MAGSLLPDISTRPYRYCKFSSHFSYSQRNSVIETYIILAYFFMYTVGENRLHVHRTCERSYYKSKNDWGTLVPRINVENVGWVHPIHKYLRARYHNVARQRFGKHRLKFGIVTNKQKSVCYATACQNSFSCQQRFSQSFRGYEEPWDHQAFALQWIQETNNFYSVLPNL
jgi:hypothetical protein